MTTMTSSPAMARLRNHCVSIAGIGIATAGSAFLLAPRKSVATLCLMIAGAVIGSLLVVELATTRTTANPTIETPTIPLAYATSIVFAGAFRPLVAILCIGLVATVLHVLF